MIRTFTAITMLAACVALPVTAQADPDELLRLPSSGEVRDERVRDRVKADRLKPGGGLFVTFDTNNDGTITAQEITDGVPLAFADADANEDGYLTAIEQQNWARNLPTRDDSLANPTRFDPNLDRRVDLKEFTAVIRDLGIDYADEASGQIMLASLKAPPKQVRRTLNPFDDETKRAQRDDRVQRR